MRFIWIFLLIGAVIAVIAGYTLWHSKKPIKIGVIYSPGTAMGTEANLAVRFYQNRFPKIDKRKVAFIFKTPELDEHALVQAYRELEKEGVSVIIGGGVSKAGVVLAKEAKRSKIPTFGSTTSTEILSGLKDNFYRPVMSTKIQAESSIPFLRQMGVKRMAIVPHVRNIAYTGTYAKSLIKKFPGQSEVFPFKPGPGFYEQVRSFEPDAVFMILPSPALLRFVKESRLSRDVVLISSEWGYLLSQYSAPLTREIFITSQNGKVQPEYVNLLKSFESFYNQPATFSTEYTFSTLDIIYKAIKEVGGDPDRLNRYFSSPRIYDYVYGRMFIDEYGDGTHEYYYIYKFHQGSLEVHQRFEVKAFPAE